MANQILVEIHEHISRQLDDDRKDIAEALSRADEERKMFIDGKMDELKTIRDYLINQFGLNTQKYY